MKVSDILNVLKYNEILCNNGDDVIKSGYTSDLLSDVMGNAKEDSVLITIQGHKNTVAVATLAGINVIILCNGRSAPADMVEAAKNEEIAIFNTRKNQFEVSCEIGKLLEK